MYKCQQIGTVDSKSLLINFEHTTTSKRLEYPHNFLTETKI